MRDCLHGLVVWALAAVAGALLAAATVGAIAKTAADKGLTPTDRSVDLLLRGEGPAAAKGVNPISDATRGFVSRLVAENPSGDFSNEGKSYLSSVITGAGAPPAAAADRVNRVASEMKADADKPRDWAEDSAIKTSTSAILCEWRESVHSERRTQWDAAFSSGCSGFLSRSSFCWL